MLGAQLKVRLVGWNMAVSDGLALVNAAGNVPVVKDHHAFAFAYVAAPILFTARICQEYEVAGARFVSTTLGVIPVLIHEVSQALLLIVSMQYSYLVVFVLAAQLNVRLTG